MPYLIENTDKTTALREPTPGCWYVLDTNRKDSPIRWTGEQFITQQGDKAIPWYHHLIELESSPLWIGAPEKAEATGLALRWLETLINSPAVTWDPAQKEAAQRALDAARAPI
jgi:hypothetical protein